MHQGTIKAVLLLFACQATQSFFDGNSLLLESVSALVENFQALNRSGISVVGTNTSISAEFDEDFRLLDLLELFLPDTPRFRQFFDDLPLNAGKLFNFKVSNFSLDVDTGAWSIGTKPFPAWTIKRGVLVVSDVTVFVSVVVPLLSLKNNESSSNETISLESYAIAGTVWIGRVGVDLTIGRGVGSDLIFRGAPTSGSLPVGSFVEWLGSKILPDDLEKPLRSLGLDRFVIERAGVIATSGSDGFSFGVSGTPTLGGWSDYRCHFIATRYAAQSHRKARTVFTFAIALPKFTLAGLVRTLTGGSVDISDVPLLGTLTVQETGVVVSSDDAEPLLLPELFDGFLANAMPISKGVTLVATIPFVDDEPPVLFVLKIGLEGVSFFVNDSGSSLTVGHLIDALVPDFDIDELELTRLPGVSHLLDVQMTQFELDTTKPKTLIVEFSLGEEIEVIPGLLAVVDPSITINMTLTKPRKTSYNANGYLRIGPADFNAQIGPSSSGKGLVVSADYPMIDISEILDKFQASFFPPELASALKAASIIDFNILQPRLGIPIGSELFVELSGRPQIAGWDGVRLSGVVAKTSAGVAMASGFEFVDANFAGLIKKITGFDVSFLKLLDRSLQAAVVISSNSMPNVRLHGDVLNKIAIEQGLSIVAVFAFPADCEGDSFCEFCKEALGKDVSLQLSATLSSISQFVVAASVNDIRLGGGVSLSRCALEFGIGAETFVGISATLALSNPPLKFTGELRAGVRGVTMTMMMEGLWKRAFGIDYLAFGNGIISMTLKAVTPWLTGLEIGGEVWLGRIDSGKEIKIAVYVGIDVVTVNDCYFYGSANRLTMNTLLRAFDFDIALPPVLGNSGFPEGISVSFSSIPRTLSPSGRSLPQGIFINGTINILGFRLKAYVNVGLPQGIKIDISMTPLNLAGGLIRLRRSKDDSSNGPMLFADVKLFPLPSISVKAQGYISFLRGMIEREVYLEITNSQFLMMVKGRFFLFDAELKIHAPYGSLRSASFQVYGRLSMAWLTELADRTANVIKRGADKATRKIGDAQRKVDGARSYLRRQQAKLSRARNNLYRMCRIRSCGSWCVGCPAWNRCCFRWWGRCGGCPGWNSCCWRAPDLFCHAANAACYVARAAVTAVIWGLERILDVASAALSAANAVLEGVKFAVRVGAAAAAAIVKFALGGLINIKQIEFDVKIGLAAGGRFKARMTVSFLRRYDVTLTFELRLRGIDAMATDLADAEFPGISGRSKRDVAERMRRALPDFSHRHYFPDQYVRQPGDNEAAAARRHRALRSVSIQSAEVVAKAEELSHKAIGIGERRIGMTLKYAEEFEKRVFANADVSAIPEQDENEDEVEVVVDVYDSEEETGSDDKRCREFDRLESFIRKLPEMIEATFEGLSHSQTLKNETSAEYDHDFQEAERYRLKTSNHSREVREAVEANEDDDEEIMAVKEELEKNITAMERGESKVYDKIKEDLQLWKDQSEKRLSEQDGRGVGSLISPFRREILNKTGLSFEEYTTKLVYRLSRLYEGIGMFDARYGNATIIVESLSVIGDNLLVLPTQTMQQAKELADKTLIEFDKIEETKVFCQ